MNTGLQVLRAKIRGLQAAGISIHNRIRKAKGLKRNRLWDEKRCLGGYNREHLIAYGLLRGVPYERIERCAKENRPNVTRVFELMKAHSDWSVTRQLTVGKVKELLTPISNTTTPPQSLPPTSHTPQLEEPLQGAQRLLEKTT
jgi:hypothetical protein